jgi:transcriptional regulator with XRE-family HTH domain
MPPKNPQLAALIRDRRTALGLTMQQLADRVGVTKSNVHYWESGEGAPKAALLEPLSQALEVSYEDLFALAGVARPDGLPTLTPYLRAKYRELPDEALAEAEAFFRDLESRYGGPDGDRP